MLVRSDLLSSIEAVCPLLTWVASPEIIVYYPLLVVQQFERVWYLPILHLACLRANPFWLYVESTSKVSLFGLWSYEDASPVSLDGPFFIELNVRFVHLTAQLFEVLESL